MSKIQVPQVDVLTSFRASEQRIRDAISAVLDSGWYVLGSEVETFEQRFADYVGVQHGVGVGSGTDAIEIALRSCGVVPGDQVLTVSHTAVATVAAIERVGAEVVFVDIERDSFTMSPTALAATIASLTTDTTKNRPTAVVPVHLYGQFADMESINQIARQHGLRVIEDCAQAHGASWANRRAGSWGDAAAFSFYPTKNLGAIGDGGMVVTDDPAIAEQAMEQRQYGWRERYISSTAGGNSRLDELQAAILNVKLDTLEQETEQRIAVAARYTQALSGTTIEPPAMREQVRHVFHQYVASCDDRDDLRQQLHQHGVATAVHYPQPVHWQPAYKQRCLGADQLPITESIIPRIVSLPMFPQLTDQQVAVVCNALQSWQR